MVTTINKFLVALATAIGVLIVVVDNGITGEEWLIVAMNALNAVGVYAVPYAVQRRRPGP